VSGAQSRRDQPRCSAAIRHTRCSQRSAEATSCLRRRGFHCSRVSLSACGAHTECTPTERVQGRTVEGFAEAFYDLSTAGTPSEVKIWSRGAERNPRGSGSIVTIGLTIDNGGREPIELVADHLRLESVQAAADTRIAVVHQYPRPVVVQGHRR
jgi:Tfp pilus assembly protein PilX